MKFRFLILALTSYVVLLLMSLASGVDKSCGLPLALESEISDKYQGKRIVTLLDLDEHDKELFRKEHGNACPGLVKVDFYGDGKPTLAFVLIDKGKVRKAELIVAHRVGDKWETTLLDTAKDSVPVVWGQDPGEYQDVYGEKKLLARRPVVVFCGYEAWAILYAWTGTHVDKIWLLD